MVSVFRPWERRREALVAEIGKAGADSTPTSERKPAPFLAESPFDRGRMLNEVDDLVEMIAPESLYDSPDCVLDNIINAWADEWVADLERQHAEFRVTALRELRVTEAQLAAHRLLRDHDLSYQSEMDGAVSSIVSGGRDHE